MAIGTVNGTNMVVSVDWKRIIPRKPRWMNGEIMRRLVIKMVFCVVLVNSTKRPGKLNKKGVLLENQSPISFLCSVFMLRNIRKVKK